MSNIELAKDEAAYLVAPEQTGDLRGWLAVFAVALSATVFCTTEFLPVGILRYISQDLGVTEGLAGIMVTAPGLLAAFAAPIVTLAVGNHDRRRVLWGLGILLVVSNLIAMVAPNFATLILGRALFGIGLGGFWAIGAGLGARLVPAKAAGRATAVIFAGVSIGMLIGGPAGALLGDLLGWRVAFGASLALSVLSLAIQFLALPKLAAEKAIRLADLLNILATTNGRVGIAAMFLVLCGQFATYTYVTPFLAQMSGFDGRMISSLLLGYTAIGLVGNFIGGAGSDRAVKRMLLLTILFILAPVAVLPVLGSFQMAAIGLLAVWGLAYGAMPVALQRWMAAAAPEAREGGMALFVGNFQISIAIGSFLGGLVVDHVGLGAAMYFGAVLAMTALLVLAIFGRNGRTAR